MGNGDGFLELGTNKPLYYDRGRIRVESVDQLSLERRTGYGYETDISGALNAAEKRYLQVSGQIPERPEQKAETTLNEMAENVKRIIESQDEQGRWVWQQNRFRDELPVSKWNGEYRTEDRISSGMFNRNVDVLCNFLEEFKKFSKK